MTIPQLSYNVSYKMPEDYSPFSKKEFVFCDVSVKLLHDLDIFQQITSISYIYILATRKY